MGIEQFDGKNNFDVDSKPEGLEREKILSKEVVVESLKTKGYNEETISLLEEFTRQSEERFLKEGRSDARIESLREKSHTLNLAGFYGESISVMEDVLEIAENEGDTESIEEARWIIEKLVFKQKEENKKRESLRQKEIREKELIEETKIKLEALSGPKIEKIEVLNAYKNLPFDYKEKNPITLSDDYPDDVKLKEAEKKFKIWLIQKDIDSQKNENVRLRNEFDKTMFFIDAGFVSKDYLDEILSLLYQDSADVEKDINDPERIELRKDMAKAMLRIRALLKM